MSVLFYDAAVFDVGVLGYLVQLRWHLVVGFLHHVGEMRGGVIEQAVGVVELHEPPRVHHHHAVWVHDGVQPVRHRQHGAVREAFSYCILNEFIRSETKCIFIKYETPVCVDWCLQNLVLLYVVEQYKLLGLPNNLLLLLLFPRSKSHSLRIPIYFFNIKIVIFAHLVDQI